MGSYGGIFSVAAVVVGSTFVLGGSSLGARQPSVDDRRGETTEVSRASDMGVDSLVFGQATVVLTTTVFFTEKQGGDRRAWSVELETPMTPRLATAADIFRNVRGLLERGMVVPSPRLANAPTMRIDGHRMFFDDDSFSAVDRAFIGVFRQVRRNGEWTCVNCADRVEIGSPFSRIVKTAGREGGRRTLSIRDLDCLPLRLGGLSCVDPELGTYEVPWLLVEAIDTDVRLAVTMHQSYFRSSDNRSVTFKEATVEARTNAFQVATRQPDRVPRLGRFETSMTPGLESVYTRLRYGVAVNRRFDPVPPHAPFLHINGQRVHHEDSDFRTAREILLTTIEEAVQSGTWTCVRCAEYRRAGNAISRIVENRDREEERRTFSIEELDCRSLGDGRLECVDSEFGIFEISWDDR